MSPDGQRAVFLRIQSDSTDAVLVTAGTTDGAEHTVATLHATGFVPDYGPAWSPDGQRIVCLDTQHDSGGGIATSHVITIRPDGSGRQELAGKSLYFVRQLAWSSDGSSILVAGQDQPSAYAPQIWQLSYPAGDVRQLTNQIETFETLSVDKAVSTLVTVQRSVRSSIWLTPANDAARSTHLSSLFGAMEGKAGLSWTPTASLVYTSFVSGDWVLLASDADGNNMRQLTYATGGDQDPIVTRDGRTLIFASNRKGGRSIWAMNTDGGNLRQLTNGYLDWLPYPSPDNQSVFYASLNRGVRTIWRVGIDGRGATQVSDIPCDKPAVSPNGSTVACYSPAPAVKSMPGVVLLPQAGGPPTKVLQIPATFETGSSVMRWTPDGRAIAYIDTREGVSNIWSLPIDGGPAHKLTDFASERMYKFDFTADGLRIASARGTSMSDVVLLRNFR